MQDRRALPHWGTAVPFSVPQGKVLWNLHKSPEQTFPEGTEKKQ